MSLCLQIRQYGFVLFTFKIRFSVVFNLYAKKYRSYSNRKKTILIGPSLKTLITSFTINLNI